MPVKLPQIRGTGYDAALRESIDSVHHEENACRSELAAPGVAATERSQIERYGAAAGKPWMAEAWPLMDQITIVASVVDILYQSLVQRAARGERRRRAGAALFLIAMGTVAGLAG